MKRIVQALVVILLLVAVVAGGYWYYKNHNASSTAAATSASLTQVVTAQRGNLSANISVVGELDAVQSADLAFEHMSDTAKLQSLVVKAGNTVKAGQVLATIDPKPYQQVLDQANSDLQAAQVKLADLETPVTALDIAKADLDIATAQYQRQEALDALATLEQPDMAQLKANVADAQSALAQAQASVVAAKSTTAAQDQLTKLRDAESQLTVEHGRLANETYSDAFYQDRRQTAYNKMMDAVDARVTAEVQPQVNALKAQVQVRTAQQTLADAQKALADAQAGARASTDAALALAKAQLAVKDADVALATAQDARAKLDEGTDAVTLAAAQADVDKKQLAVTDAEMALAGTRLTAPFDGTVLQTNVAVGDVVASNTPILTVANLNDLQVLASVDETTIRRVSAGQPAQITFDAVPGQTLQGKVGDVPLQGTLQGGVMVYQVPISLVGADKLPLLVGMTANVKIAVGQAENALLIPAMALQKANGMYQVLVPNTADPAGQPEAVPVEVGLSDGTYTQIVRGLNEGDDVLVQLSAAQSNTNTNFRGGGGGFIGIPFGGGR
jgi:multidrug efflux pump subunit AcrA (membrane-fusion protein)